MSHTVKQKTRLLARVRRIRGQIEGVERALEAEAPCSEVLRQIASVRGAISGLTAELMEDHLREHVVAAQDDEARRSGAEEMIEIIRTYLK
ncbi:metal/formaldehyde-sensitive transcriptional repressor [Paenirhodobacter sp.]|uniref:metal/formaldehyde-sensitive transcriptional repressor n=1 Tax=Paenirhodobacter sp. TaxID=1965326 RepID=UPI003B3DE403